MQRKRAFTLIELLVVIAIIAILAAILFPVFAKARERAKQSKSLNNIKQLALAFQSYSQDYQEALPGWVQNPNGAYARNVWDEQINANVKSKDVYNNGDTGIQSPSQPAPWNRVLTYGLNMLLITNPKPTFDGRADVSNPTAANPPATMSSSSVTDPAGTILLAELATNAANSGAIAAFKTPNPYPFTHTPDNTKGSSQYQSAIVSQIDLSPREWVENKQIGSLDNYDENKWQSDNGVARDLYGGGGVYAFIDGHVQFMKIAKSVGWGMTDSTGKAITSSALAWGPNNNNNMWNPNR